MNLEIVRFLQKLDAPLFVTFVKSLNFFDTTPFLFILLPFLWINLGKKTGLRFFCILLLNGILNQLLKSFFVHLRPFQLEPSLKIIEVSGYSFPSGAAQTATLLSALMLFFWKNRLKWLVAPLYCFLICFSRVYLGVHFLEDVIAGIFIGCLLFFFYIFAFQKIERWFSNFSLAKVTYLVSSSFLFLTLIVTESSYIQFFSAAFGVALGYYLNDFLKLGGEKREKVDQFCFDIPVAILGAFFIFIMTQKAFISHLKIKLFIQSSMLGLWLSFISIYVSSFLTLKRKKEKQSQL